MDRDAGQSKVYGKPEVTLEPNLSSSHHRYFILKATIDQSRHRSCQIKFDSNLENPANVFEIKVIFFLDWLSIFLLTKIMELRSLFFLFFQPLFFYNLPGFYTWNKQRLLPHSHVKWNWRKRLFVNSSKSYSMSFTILSIVSINSSFNWRQNLFQLVMPYYLLRSARPFFLKLCISWVCPYLTSKCKLQDHSIIISSTSGYSMIFSSTWL